MCVRERTNETENEDVGVHYAECAVALALLPLNFASETPRDDIFIRVLSRTCDTKTGISKCTIKLSSASLLENETSFLSLSLSLSLILSVASLYRSELNLTRYTSHWEIVKLSNRTTRTIIG